VIFVKKSFFLVYYLFLLYDDFHYGIFHSISSLIFICRKKTEFERKFASQQ